MEIGVLDVVVDILVELVAEMVFVMELHIQQVPMIMELARIVADI